MSLTGIATVNAGEPDTIPPNPLKWYASLEGGVQMSGIKDEDFVSKNIAPQVAFSVGRWFTPYLALQVGYKGYYFNTIADDMKHHYGYYHGEIVVNLDQLIKPAPIPRVWSLTFTVGSGYFYNYQYHHPNVCATLGIQNNILLLQNLTLFVDLSAIIGWDIYQGDEDILPSAAIGVKYNF